MRISLLYLLLTGMAAADATEGLRALHAGNPEKAARLLEAAAEEAPDDADLHASWGVALLETGEWDRAAEVLRTSLRLRPEPDVAFNLAIAEFRRGDLPRSWSAVSLALRWAGEGRLLERAAELGLAVARRLDDPEPALREIVLWAPGTDAAAEAARILE
ncbi:MAG: tetratricopeptide repeat protein [Candidatus Brocadiae bacterium]|nr:tetratricopeptide repeat protein [Candidatus Brocadiia bacterium]